jgi:hypothetical protein
MVIRPSRRAFTGRDRRAQAAGSSDVGSSCPIFSSAAKRSIIGKDTTRRWIFAARMLLNYDVASAVFVGWLRIECLVNA